MFLSKEGTAAEYGMLAKEDIEEGHVLFSIPREVLLHQGTTKVKKVLEEGIRTFKFIEIPPSIAGLYPYNHMLSREEIFGECIRLGSSSSGSPI